ncbi:MAG: threonylcarbamoyl-AMP synthase [Christensenellaceae bacterium]|jgi:L-threonylcarbamoyladenylate synthase|nr:threonylcarbamoyl-AMP synthase [Christensenellaceae bacterium]
MACRMKTKIRLLNEASVEEAAGILRAGGLVAFPTETVYGLGANALDEGAVRGIFLAKGRPQDNPLIVHLPKSELPAGLVSALPDAAECLMEAFWPGPLTLVLPKGPKIPDAVSAGLPTVALRAPAHEGAQALLRAAGLPIAAPSANASGRPSPTLARHVFDDLSGKIPLILDGGACEIGIESTVLDLSGAEPVLLRPGSVTLEELGAALGKTPRLGRGVMRPLPAGERALSPGLLHRHYAPRAEVILVRGEGEALVQRLKDEYDAAENALILCADALLDRLQPRNCQGLGADERRMAKTLFAALRQADERSFSKVILQGVAEEGLGLALMNRALRAAGFRAVGP